MEQLTLSFSQTTFDLTMGENQTQDLTFKETIQGGSDYNMLAHRPSINGVELLGNLTIEDIGEETITNQELMEIIDKYYSEVFK